MTSPRSNLLYQQDEPQEDSCFNSKPSYYKRGNLLATSSFRQKCRGFRARSSSYTSLDDNKQEQSSLTPMVSPTITFFSRNKKERSNTAPSSFFYAKQASREDQDTTAVVNEEEDDESDESTLFAKNKRSYSRQNLKKTSSWKSNVLKAVGVKSR
jgi:hypothetical protein